MTKIYKTIADQKWEEVSINEIILVFLTGEYNECVKNFGELALIHKEIIQNPNLNNESENSIRSMLLAFRIGIMAQIPLSTKWYKVSSINESNLNELYSINDTGWVSDEDNNELLKVAKRKKINLKTDSQNFIAPILFGHNKYGPFTILEGNKRLTAIAAANARFNSVCYIGLSPDLCSWHVQDSK